MKPHSYSSLRVPKSAPRPLKKRWASVEKEIESLRKKGASAVLDEIVLLREKAEKLITKHSEGKVTGKNFPDMLWLDGALRRADKNDGS